MTEMTTSQKNEGGEKKMKVSPCCLR